MTESSRRLSPSSLVVAGVVLWTVVLCRPTLGQITLDGTLGPSGPLAGPDFTIPADVGKQVGGNLFHSFGEFNVHEGESATFTGPPTVRNVIGRVTGGDPSTIDGRLASDIPGADLYLVNPRGVMFGSNASVDVKGSFAVSTADYIRLGKTGRFDATDPARSILTVDPPAAFGFLGDRPGSIALDGANLRVPDGESVALVGGDVDMRGGSVVAHGGRIDVTSLASAGEVTSDEGLPGSEVNGAEHLGRINASGGALINASAEQGGTVVIRGGRFELSDGAVVAAVTGDGDGGGADVQVDQLSVTGGASIATTTVGAGRGGTLTISATDSVTLFGGSLESDARGPAPGAGDAGALSVSARTVRVDGGATIDTSTVGPGRGGPLSIAATDSLEVSDGARITSEAAGTGPEAGDAGSLTLSAKTVTLDTGADVDTNTLGAGVGGVLAIDADTVDASSLSTILSQSLGGTGDAGTVSISARNVTVRGARSSTPAPSVPGPAAR